MKRLTKKEVRILRAVVRARLGDEFDRVRPAIEAHKPALAKRINVFASQLVEIFGKLS